MSICDPITSDVGRNLVAILRESWRSSIGSCIWSFKTHENTFKECLRCLSFSGPKSPKSLEEEISTTTEHCCEGNGQ